MNNTILESLKENSNFIETENGAIAHKTTCINVYDMFGLGGAYRQRTDDDCIVLFKKALEEDETLAMKCLFYLRDIRGGQGERRFFRVCMKWLAKNYPEIAERNLYNIAEYGRYDDLYCLVGTPLEDKMFELIRNQVKTDLISLHNSDTTGISLLGKWLKSENASSQETKELGKLTRKALNLNHKEYRKVLKALRARINIVEKLMSENRWNEIEFDKLPSKAGLVYANAFAHKDIIADKYADFMSNKETKVNAAALYPYDLVHKVVSAIDGHYSWSTGTYSSTLNLTETEREAIQKMWDNLPDYFEGSDKNILAVVDTSGSMTSGKGVAPIDVAISLGMYCGEKTQGAFHNHYISFASRPQLIEIEGSDFADSVRRIYETNLVDNTNLIAVFNMLKHMILTGQAESADLPETIVVISDMEIDSGSCWRNKNVAATDMEKIAMEWAEVGLRLPKLVYWNVNARHNTFLGGDSRISYISGCSPSIFKGVLNGKTGYDLCVSTLMSERYSKVK